MDTDILEQLVLAQMVFAAHHRVSPAVFIEEEEDAMESDCLNLLRAQRASSPEHVITTSMLHPMNTTTLEEIKSSPPLRELQPMLVDNLQVGCCHKGRVLYGELSVEPSKLAALHMHTMVTDEAGQVVKLCVYYALRRKHRSQEIGALFPKGLKVAIKEPYFKVPMNGPSMIQVDNPADIIRNPKFIKGCGRRNNSPSPSPSPSLSTSPSSSLPLVPPPLSPPPPSSSPPSSQFKVPVHAGDLRSQGNQAFAGQAWKQAIQFYTETVQLLLQSRGISSSTISSEVSKELALVFSNRAEARLRLKHFEAAKVDAGKALKQQPHHVKSLFRKGKALHGLHQYKEAVLCFKEALNAPGENVMSMKGVTEALKASEVCNKQARSGEYDLVGLCREVEGGKEPVCGEFIGPVEIGPANERVLGRGLLVTRDVEPGELLLVSKVVAHGKAYPSSFMHPEGSRVKNEDLIQQVMDRAMSSARFREQVYRLAVNSTTGVGGIESSIPTMDVFLAKPEAARCDDVSLNLEDIDIDRISGVIETNAFEDACELHAALWLLPSFINHSCTPNSCWMKLGKEALFVRAAHHLTKGQEVTISYLETATLPYAVRAPLFQHCRGFDCRCDRCNLEKSLEPFTKPLQVKLALQPLDILGAAEVVESLEWAFQNTKAFENEKHKQWLYSSYSGCFVLALQDTRLQQRMSKFELLETVLKAVQETMGGSEAFLVFIREFVHESECSSRVKASLDAMYVSLYGKQPRATLRVLLALRMSKMEKAFNTIGRYSLDGNCHEPWQPWQSSL